MLDTVVGDIRRGESQVVSPAGRGRGIGEDGPARVPDCVGAGTVAVLRAVGLESEMELAYSGLHQLCGTMLDQLERVPDPHRLTLEVVFGLIAGAARTRFSSPWGCPTRRSVHGCSSAPARWSGT